jgi:flagellar biosynthesis GTPase FlhF
MGRKGKKIMGFDKSDHSIFSRAGRRPSGQSLLATLSGDIDGDGAPLDKLCHMPATARQQDVKAQLDEALGQRSEEDEEGDIPLDDLIPNDRVNPEIEAALVAAEEAEREVALVAAEEAEREAAREAAEEAEREAARVAAEEAEREAARVAAEEAEREAARVAAEEAEREAARVAAELNWKWPKGE